MKYVVLLAILCVSSSFIPNPPKAEVLSENPRVLLIPNFLTEAECDHLIAEARPHLKRSKVVNETAGGEKLDDARSSKGMFFPSFTTDSTVKWIESRIAQFTQIPKENGEAIQVLQYPVGAEYRPHYDYFDRNTPGGAACLARGGQRVATLIMYLNTAEAGGETIFPKLNLKVVPKKGYAVLFYNCRPDGKEDPMTLHGGAPVIQGEKWIATKWLHETVFN